MDGVYTQGYWVYRVPQQEAGGEFFEMIKVNELLSPLVWLSLLLLF